MQRGLHQNPDLSFPCRKTMNAWVTDKAVEVKALIKEKVRGQPIALTGHGWDSTNGSGAFYALTAHMMDPDTNNLMAYTLACRKLADRHTGRNISELNLEILSEYDIDPRDVTVFTSDTAANQKLAVKLMGVEWLACSCHVFELSSKVVLKQQGVAKVVTKCKTIIGHSHKSDNSGRELAAAQRFYEKPERKLKKWSDTRWWSLCDSLESVADNEGPINAMVDKARAQDKSCAITKLTEHEYKICRDLVKVMSPMRALQKPLEGEKYVTISHVDFQVSRALQKLALAQTRTGVAVEVAEAAALVEEDIIKRWHPEDEILSARSKQKLEKPLRIPRLAAVLDPRFKALSQASREEADRLYWDVLEDELRALIDEEGQRSLEQCDRDMRGGYVLEEPEEEVDPDSLAGMLKEAAASRWELVHSSDGDDDNEDDEPRRKKKRLDPSERPYAEGLAELTRYRAMPPEKCDVIHDLGGPLKWWKQKEELYPTLSKLAFRFLAVQATSAASERLFSTAKLIMTDKRSRLTDDYAENP